jgi:uncharacterized protein (TIGR00255 family)
MILSMTGFGKTTFETSNKSYSIEIRSVNSKQLDLNLRIPSLLRDKEPVLRTLMQKSAERGKIDVAVYFEQKKTTTESFFNKELIKKYYKELHAICKDLKQDEQNLMSTILRLPEVMDTKPQEIDDQEWNNFTKHFQKALNAFNKHRQDEGKVLEKDFTLRINAIAQLLKKTEAADKKRLPSIRERIVKNLNEKIEKNKIDNNRLEQELIYYIERNDITEEKIRLKTHLDYFSTTMKEHAPGRKLGFIAQEIGREINTVGSKANDAEIQKLVVQMKDELEKIKEQLNNVL